MHLLGLQKIKKNTKCIFLETPSNPLMEIIDIQHVSNIAHQYGALVIVDNIFASPVLQKPINFGTIFWQFLAFFNTILSILLGLGFYDLIVNSFIFNHLQGNK